MKLKGRVTAYLPEEIQTALEKWAEEESRSLSSLATYLLTQAVKERQQKEKKDWWERSSYLRKLMSKLAKLWIIYFGKLYVFRNRRINLGKGRA